MIRTADRTRQGVRTRGVGTIARDAVRRFRGADGTSHARALAYQVAFVVISGLIGIVGLASVLGIREIRDVVVQLATLLSPGPSERLIEEAARQGASGGPLALAAGIGSALIAGTFAMAQVERSANRLLGLRDDRPGARRYAVAFSLALSAGVMLALALLLLAGGRAIADGAGLEDAVATAWSILRWPLGALIAAGAVYLLFRTAPNGYAGPREALAWGSVVAVGLWVLFTGALAVYLAVSEPTQQAYGPLLSIVALLLWAVLASLALHLGFAVAAELADATIEGSSATAPDRELVRVPDTADAARPDQPA